MVCAASGRLCDSSTLQSLDSTAALQSVIDFECSFVEDTAIGENMDFSEFLHISIRGIINAKPLKEKRHYLPVRCKTVTVGSTASVPARLL